MLDRKVLRWSMHVKRKYYFLIIIFSIIMNAKMEVANGKKSKKKYWLNLVRGGFARRDVGLPKQV